MRRTHGQIFHAAKHCRPFPTGHARIPGDSDNLKNGVTVNRDLVIAAALLHDITKIRSLETREPHDQSGGELLRELGFTSVGEIVKQHVILQDFNPQETLAEREITYYADKRVMHDRIVSLAERVEDLIQRYGITEEIKNRIRQNASMAYVIEKKIAGSMTVDLDYAIRRIQAGDCIGCSGYLSS